MEWLYSDKLKDNNLIEKLESELNYNFPVDFKKIVLLNNGACPTPNVFDSKVSRENVFDHLLSFNKEDKANIWKINTRSDYASDKYIIFGICSFGDFLCFDKETNNVIYLDHETMEIEEAATTFTQFINSFYDPEMQNKR